MQANSIAGGVHVYTGSRSRGVPQQLPSAPKLFTGRARELTDLTAALDSGNRPSGTVVISAIGGSGGIGKTWLALHWAHQNKDRFADGQLYVNLRGFGASGKPMCPTVAIRGFLDAFGVGPAATPVDPDAQAALYRSLVAGKRMLIVLDNARDSDHVIPLLPGSSSCTVLVTSRNQLTSLVTAHDAFRLDLNVLDKADGRKLLARYVDNVRISAEPDAMAEILGYCAGLPLALRIVAARVSAQPEFPLTVFADELRDCSARLDALSAGDAQANLRTVLSCSYRYLNAEAAAVFGLLGLAPGPDISLAAVVSLTDLPALRARAVLRDLELAYLVTQHLPGRYRMHDLVRLYASEQSTRDTPAEARSAALRRLVDFYRHTAYLGERALYPIRKSLNVEKPSRGCVPSRLDSETCALAWFDAEHACLLAAQHLAARQRWHKCVWELAWALSSFHRRRGHLHDDVAVWRAGLDAAYQMIDPPACGWAHRFLAHACTRAGMQRDAYDHLRHANSLTDRIDKGIDHSSAPAEPDGVQQAYGHPPCGPSWDDGQALAEISHGLRVYRERLHDPVLEADALNAMGFLQTRLGRPHEARTSCESALALFRRHHDAVGEAAALDSLGYLAQHTGQHTVAVVYFHQALALRRDVGDSFGEADTLGRLGKAYAALGLRADARKFWRQALDQFHTQHRPTEAERIRQELAALHALARHRR